MWKCAIDKGWDIDFVEGPNNKSGLIGVSLKSMLLKFDENPAEALDTAPL